MCQILFSIAQIFSYQLSPCCHISFLLFLVHPAPLPTGGFTASFVQTSQRFRTCQNQEGAAYNKKETELPLILNSKCVLSINFRPFANPPLEPLLGKADFSSRELTFRHFSNILRILLKDKRIVILIECFKIYLRL